jgi:molecular chaperone DnaK (HSP70)
MRPWTAVTRSVPADSAARGARHDRIGAAVAVVPLPAAAGESKSGEAIVGAYARQRASEVPDRVVASAKSWLSYGGADRDAVLLPWGAGDDVPKLTPVAASAKYLTHLAAAWNAAFPKDPLAAQDVLLTVPGVVRSRRARAHGAGGRRRRAADGDAARGAAGGALRLDRRRRRGVATSDRGRRSLLVCDVGGGTTTSA